MMNDSINRVNTTIAVASFNFYQDEATQFAIYPGKGTFLGLVYTTLKMNGEAGEIAEKIGKIMRDENSVLSTVHKDALLFELGDVLWYIAAQAKELGFTLEEVANANIAKLASRSARGKLSGSGDNR